MEFLQERIVVQEEIDELNHVNNVVYLKWINAISGKHWKSVSNAAIDAKYIWVAARHEIDYIKPALLGDTITLKTWIASIEGVKSIRRVEMYKDDILLAKSKTIWVMLDAKTFKVTRIPEEIKVLF